MHAVKNDPDSDVYIIGSITAVAKNYTGGNYMSTLLNDVVGLCSESVEGVYAENS